MKHSVLHTSFLIALFFSLLAITQSARALSPTDDSIFPSSHRPWIGSALGRDIQCTLLVTPRGLFDARELSRQASWHERIILLEDDPEDTEDELRKALKSTDVFVCNQRLWLTLSAETHTLISTYLHKGMGLVIVGFDSNGDLTTAWESLDTPPELEYAYSKPDAFMYGESPGSWSVFQSEKGRIAVYNGVSPPVAHELLPVNYIDGVDTATVYDYHIAPLLRAVQWAAKRNPGLHLSIVHSTDLGKPDPVAVPPQYPPEFLEYMLDVQQHPPTSTFQLHLNRPAPKTYTLEVRLRQPYRNTTLYLDEVLWPKGQDQYTLRVPLTRGDIWMDVWILDGEEVVNWYSTSSYNDPWPMITNVNFSKAYVNPTDYLDVSFYLRPNRSKPVPTRAFYRVIDTHNRIISEKNVLIPPEAGEVKTQISWNDAMTRQLRVEVFLTEEHVQSVSTWVERLASYAYTTLSVEQPPSPRLRWGMNGATLNEPALMYMNQRLTQWGSKMVHVPSRELEGFTGIAQNLATASHLNAIPKQSLNEQDHLVPCLSAQEFIEGQYNLVQRWAFHQAPASTQTLSLGSGTQALVNPELGFCHSPDCRAYLHDQLKHVYPTIEVLNTVWKTSFASWSEVSIPDHATASTPAWMDIQTIRGALQADTIDSLYAQVSDTHPGLPIGLCLANVSIGPLTHDWARLLQTVSWINVPYDPLLLDKFQAYQNDTATLDFTITPQQLSDSKQWPWQALFQGVHTVWLNQNDDFPGYIPAAITSDIDTFSAAFNGIQQGIEALIHHAVPAPPSIVIYENNSTRLYADEDQLEVLQNAQQSLILALQSAGLSYTFASYTHLLDTGFKEYPIVVLPQVHTLSFEEEFLLTHYAEQGGHLIADTVPGTRDEHGQTLTIKRPLEQQIHIAPLELLEVDIQTLATELNIPRTHPPTMKSSWINTDLQWFHYRYGKADLYAVLQHQDKKTSLPHVQIPKNYWGIDLLAEKYKIQNLSHPQYRKKILRPKINDAQASLFAYLPYRVSRLIIDTPEKIHSGQRLNYGVTIKTYDALPGDHLLQVRLLDPYGESIPYYEGTLEYHEGKADAKSYIPLAHNELPGTYTLEILDIMTGVSHHQAIEIASAKSMHIGTK